MDVANTGIAAIFLLISFATITWAFLQKRIAYEQTVRERVQKIGGRGRQGVKSQKNNQKRRQRDVDAVLADMEEQEKARANKATKPSLVLRMRQGGLTWSRRTYFLVSLVVGVLAILFFMAYGLNTFAAAGFGGACGLLLPHLYVGFMRKRRLKKFSKEFPNAIDVIARGLRTGLPLADCMRIIANESAYPVNEEFAALVDEQVLGETLPVAADNMAQRVPLTEVNFFAIVISIQSKTGGSLSESFENLSKVLRERKMMAEKIKAVSQEAKSSASIIGSLPFLVAGIIYLIDPEYITILFTETGGNIALAISGLWMGFGVFVMQKMINFNF